MKFSKIGLGVLAISVAIAACQNVDFKKTSAGIPYKIFSSKSGDSARPGTIVRYEVIQKIKDSVMYSSYALQQSAYAEIKPSSQPLDYANTRGNVEEILSKAKEGDSIYLVQSTDSLLKQSPQSTLKRGEQLVTTIRVVDIYKSRDEANADIMKQEGVAYEKNKSQGLENFKKDTAAQASIQKDDKIIEDYLKAHNIQAEKNQWGLYIQRLAPGQAAKPKFGQFSNVRYKGMHLSGEVFDQNTMPVQIGISRVVFGFMEGVSELSKGEKARIYIPSLLGYGPQGNPPKIKPNEVLIFEIEVLDISDKEPAPQQQPVPQGNK